MVKLALPKEFEITTGATILKFNYLRRYVREISPQHTFIWSDTGRWIASHVVVEREAAVMLILAHGFIEVE